MYCTNILYPVAVYDDATVFDTMKENNIHRNQSCFCYFENVQKE